MSKKISDGEIVEAIESRDQRRINLVMGYLYTEHFQVVRRFIVKNSGSEAEASDIFQDALVLFYMKVRKAEFQSTSSLKTYLFGIGRNLWLKELRRRRIASRNFIENDEHEYQEELFLQTSQITIRKVMELINEECKRLLMDFYFEGQSMLQLTSKYGLGSESATKNKKYRCLQKLIGLVRQRKLERSDFNNE